MSYLRVRSTQTIQQPIGLVTETDSVFGMAHSKARAIGQPSETDTAFSVTLAPPGSPVWATIPKVTFTLGTPSNVSISQYDSKGATDVITRVQGVLSGVSYNQALKRLEYTGAGAIGSANFQYLADDATADADWNTLKASSVMATRFDTAGEVLDYRLLDPGSNYLNITHDTSRKWFPTGSMRFAIPNSAGESCGDWFRHLDDSFGLFTGSGGQPGGLSNSTNQGYDPPMVFEIAHAIYVTAAMRDTFFPGGGGWKHGLVSHDGKSNNSFEVVWQNTNQRGAPQGYTQNPPNTQPWQANVDYGCVAAFPDILFQPNLIRAAGALTALSATNPDNGLAWSVCQQAWGRGWVYSYEVSGYPNHIGTGRVWKYWEQLDPQGASIGPLLYPQDDWIVFKIRVDLNSYSSATNRVRWYAGRRWHTGWQLIMDSQNCLLPTEVSDFGQGFNKRFNTNWQTFFHTNRTGGGGVSTFANVGWIVSRRDGGVVSFPVYWPPPG